MNKISSSWLPSNYIFSINNIVSMVYLQRNISNIVRLFTDVKFNINFGTLKTVENDNDIVLNSVIKNVDCLVGLTLLEVSNKILKLSDKKYISDELINLIKTKYQLSDDSYVIQNINPKYDFLFNIIKLQVLNNYIKKQAIGYFNYVEELYNDFYKTRNFNEKRNQSITNNYFNNNNWNSYMFYLLNIQYIQNNYLSDTMLTIKHELNSITNVLNEAEIGPIVCKWLFLLETELTNNSNNFDMVDSKSQRLIKIMLDKEIEFITFKTKKINVSYNEYKQIQNINSQSFDIKTCSDLNNVNILCVDNFNEYYIQNDLFNLFEHNQSILTYIQNICNDGISLGKQLLNELKYRDVSKQDKQTHLPNGKIDRRLLSNLAFNDTNIFYDVKYSKYKEKTIVISIDSSKSMSGDNWKYTQMLVSALIYVFTNIRNIRLIIYYRTTIKESNTKENIKNVNPLLIKAFDSFSDNENKINILKYIKPQGGSPEGILMDTIYNKHIKQNEHIDYFINISDGCPQYYNFDINYDGEYAINHTKKTIEKYKRNGINVLSYFIGSVVDFPKFKSMYGKSSVFIENVVNMKNIAYSLNNILLNNLDN